MERRPRSRQANRDSCRRGKRRAPARRRGLAAYIAWADGDVRKLNGVPPAPGDPNAALIPDTADLSVLPLAPKSPIRLEALFSADKVVCDQYAALTSRIAQESSALQTLETRQMLLGHKNGQITTHYSAAEIGELIDAVEKSELVRCIGTDPDLDQK